MKSRIRSRWHKPNEKPLENDSSPAPQAPIGEINPADVSFLSDDLSNYKPSSSKPVEPSSSSSQTGNRNRNRRGDRGDNRSTRGKNRGPRNSNDRKEKGSRIASNRAITTDRKTLTTEKAEDQVKEKGEVRTKPVPPKSKEMIILEIPEEITTGKTNPQTRKRKSHPG